MEPRGRDKFLRHRKLIHAVSTVLRVLPRSMRQKLLVWNRNTSGNVGLTIRYALLKTLAAKCGDNVGLHQGVFILCPEKLCLGSHVSIHPMCYIDATGGIDVGDHVSIAHGVTIMSTEHVYGDHDLPIKDQGVSFEPVLIEDNVWIGAKATILAGRRIRTGSIVAAGAVVVKDFAPNTIVGGVPAKALKQR